MLHASMHIDSHMQIVDSFINCSILVLQLWFLIAIILTQEETLILSPFSVISWSKFMHVIITSLKLSGACLPCWTETA